MCRQRKWSGENRMIFSRAATPGNLLNRTDDDPERQTDIRRNDKVGRGLVIIWNLRKYFSSNIAHRFCVTGGRVLCAHRTTHRSVLALVT